MEASEPMTNGCLPQKRGAALATPYGWIYRLTTQYSGFAGGYLTDRLQDMFSFFKKSRQHTIVINGTSIVAEPQETVLLAALRSGVAFPNNCRVGGCATCKCKLTHGHVKQLTDSSYVLSAEELKTGFILGCQSVPKSDISIEVDLTATRSRQIAGTIVAQTKITPDITELEIELAEPLDYKGGQYANLTLASHKELTRPYSFATKADQQGLKVKFFVRETPGGQLSGIINRQSLVGNGVVVDGPLGNFYLRESSRPILLIAGGSGLAPIMALLEEGLANGVSRPARLLFGARTMVDLYCKDEIDQIAKLWKGNFEYFPVLSDEPPDSGWQGMRGLVSEFIPTDASVQAYLCGPPAMIDESVKQLTRIGVPKEEVFADRFTSVHELKLN